MNFSSPQVTNTILTAGALQQAKMSKQMSEMSRTFGSVSTALDQQRTIQIQILKFQSDLLDETRKQTALLQLAQKREELRDASALRVTAVRQVIFEVREELNNLEQSNVEPRSMLIKLLALRDLTGSHNISPKLVDDFEDKRFVADILDELDQRIAQILNHEDNHLFKKLVADLIDIASLDVPLLPINIKNAGYNLKTLERIHENLESFLSETERGAGSARKLIFNRKLKKLIEDKYVKLELRKHWLDRMKNLSLAFLCSAVLGFFVYFFSVIYLRWSLFPTMTICFFAASAVFAIGFLVVTHKRAHIQESSIESLNRLKIEISEAIASSKDNRLKIEKHNKVIDEIEREMDRLNGLGNDVSGIFGRPTRISESDYIVV